MNNYISDKNGRTALHKGTTTDDPGIVKALLSHADIEVNAESLSGLTAVMEATKNGKMSSLKVNYI